MSVKQLQRDFMNDGIWNLTVGGAFRRAKIYRDIADSTARQKFKLSIRRKVEKLFAEVYGRRKVDGEEHIKNIATLKAQISGEFSAILNNKSITFGVVQKILNIYLKHQWCLGRSNTPPHCSVDRIMLKKANVLPLPNWTTIDSAKEYRRCIRAFERESAKNGQGLAEWELSEFNRR